ncbi:proline racemase family protein [Leucobacter sp. Marseille-Q4368]|uniref:Proline racemase family protein n=1 Tax=Leucobacter manosquensis TaxID=2810611 RepID=A0ABS5M5G0_9MICO|nr:proline racemase family protein [Leucobacter manosquensis]
MVRIEASGLLSMCGHGTIGVDTVLVETGMVDRFLSAPIEGHRVFRRQRSGTLHAFMPDA